MVGNNKKNQQGFVTLMAVIIMAAVLLVMMVSAAGIVFRGRFNALDYENKKISVALAEACVQTAMVKLAQDPAYNPPLCGECIGVDDTCAAALCAANSGKKVCRICEVTASGGGKIIYARATYKGVFTNLEAKVTPGAADVSLDSWAETETSPYAIVCNP